MRLSVKENPRMKISRREKIIYPARKVTDVYIIFGFLSSHLLIHDAYYESVCFVLFR